MNSKSFWIEGTKYLDLDIPVYVPGGGTGYVGTLRDYMQPIDGPQSLSKVATELALRDVQEHVEGNDAEQDRLQRRADRRKPGSRRHKRIWDEIYHLTHDTDEILERATDYRAETLNALEAKAQIVDYQLGHVDESSSLERRLMKSLCRDVKKVLG